MRVSVFTLSCFLAKFVRSLANCCYNRRRFKMYEVEMFLGIVFNWQHGIFSLCLCCKPRRKGCE